MGNKRVDFNFHITAGPSDVVWVKNTVKKKIVCELFATLAVRFTRSLPHE